MRTIAVLLSMFLLIGCEAVAPAEAAPPQPPPVTAVISALGGVVQANWTPDFGGFTGTSDGCMLSYSDGRFAVLPVLVEGDRMLSMVIAMAGNNAADLEISSVSVAPNGSRVPGPMDRISVFNVPDMWHDVPVELVATTVEGGAAHWFEFGADQAGLCIGAIRLTYDHP